MQDKHERWFIFSCKMSMKGLALDKRTRESNHRRHDLDDERRTPACAGTADRRDECRTTSTARLRGIDPLGTAASKYVRYGVCVFTTAQATLAIFAMTAANSLRLRFGSVGSAPTPDQSQGSSEEAGHLRSFQRFFYPLLIELLGSPAEISADRDQRECSPLGTTASSQQVSPSVPCSRPSPHRLPQEHPSRYLPFGQLSQ